MALELHLPDLEDSPIRLGPLAQGVVLVRAAQPWHHRLRETLTTYLPVLLMLLLALGTWWLVRNTPSDDGPPEPRAPLQEPDYTMRNFVVERFDKDGRLQVRIQGEQLRHFADSNTIEVDGARVRAVSTEGRVTLAQARRALANGDGTEVQLLGDARVDSTGPKGEPIAFRGEFLHVFLATEKLRSHLPVTVTRNGSEFRAAGMDYDHLSGLLQLQGKMRAVLQPSGPGTGPRP
jgi:lipopolysaccharide export system protein LptC